MAYYFKYGKMTKFLGFNLLILRNYHKFTLMLQKSALQRYPFSRNGGNEF